MKTHTQPKAGVRHDHRTDQYVPTLDGKDISPTSFDEKRALQIAETAAAAPEAPQKKNYGIFVQGNQLGHKGSDPKPAQHSPLPWQALDGMILCDKVNKYGNFYVAEVSAQFRDIANAEALSEASANLAFIVEACNNYERVKAERDRESARANRTLIERNAKIEQVRELLAACKAWERARKDGGVSMADLYEAAWQKTQAAITNAEKGAQP